MADRTIRHMVREMQIEVRDTDLQPDRAADILARLTALLGNIGDEEREADLALAQVKLTLYQQHKAASRAKMFAEVTPEYQRHREAKDCRVLAIELIRSLKTFLRTKTEERQWAGHQ